jgi:hypothetical protein
LKSLCDVKNLITLKEPADKARMFCTLLKGQALSYFGHHNTSTFESEDSELPGNDHIVLVLREIGLEYIPTRTITVK